MDIAEVQLQFASHGEDAGTGPSQDFLAWLRTRPGLSGALVVRAIGAEVVSLVVEVGSAHAIEELARSLVAWLNGRSGDITVKLSVSGTAVAMVTTRSGDITVEPAVSGKTAERQSGIKAAELDSFLHSLVTTGAPSPIPGSPVEAVGETALDARSAKTAQITFGEGSDDSYHPIDRTEIGGSGDGPDLEPEEADASTMPITIYLSNEAVHQQVETAVEALLAVAGLQIESRRDPIVGSWFRRMRAAAKAVMGSPAAREATLVAAHAVDTRLVLAQDAAVTATLLQNLGPVLTSLQPTKDAVIRVGALLIVKVDWMVNVFQLTAAQQAVLDHRPQLARSPHEIIRALNLVPEDHQGEDPPTLR